MKRNRRRKVSKTKASKIHFFRRSLDRVGYVISAENIIKQIHNPSLGIYDLTCLGRDSNRISKWQLRLEEKTFIVVYDKFRKCLITIYERIKHERKSGN